MEARETKQGKVIGNVGTLDIRTATDETVAEIRRVGNVGMVIYSPKTAHLIPRLNIGNMGSAVEVPDDAKFFTGQVDITRDYFKDQEAAQSMAIVGQLLIRPDVPAEELRDGLEKLFVCGQILCPEPLVGIVKSKLQELTGQLRTYGESTKFVLGKLTLDENYLNSLDDNAELLVLGKVDAPDILDDDLLKRKITRLEVTGKIDCRGENQTALRAILDDKGSTKISAIPAGFEPVDGSIVLDDTTLSALPGRRLQCAGSVRIASEVDADSLDQALDELRIAGLLVCPAALKEVASRKCDLFKTKAIFHAGELWLIDDDTELMASRFDYLDGKATLVVNDTLELDPAIDPKVLADRLDRVHNLDTILCTPEQMGALQARMGLNEGQLVDATKEKEEKPKEEGIGNVGTLKL